MKVDTSAIVEHLPGEPQRGAGSVRLACRIAGRALFVCCLFVLLAPLWLLYGALAFSVGQPPNVPRAAQIRRYLTRAWTERPPPPGISFGRRLWLTLTVLRRVAFVPLAATAWWLDEALYGRELDAIVVRAPLFEISAARSGSTQLARYLEDDPSLAAPSLLQSLFPYLWLWRLAPWTLGRFFTKDDVRERFERTLWPEFRERHEGEPFRTDTFEVALYLAHLNALSLFYGPDMIEEEFGFHRLHEGNRGLWEEDFVRFVERIGRKRLLDAGPGPGGRPRRLFVKGHFLCAAPALARRFPDARFLTVIRMPDKRFQSGINYMRANPVDETLGAPPWAWLADGLVRTEIAYCELEKAWYTAVDGPSRCVIRFDDYVCDLAGTMQRIYAACMEGPVPDHIPREHPPRRRHTYQLDRSLAQVGIDAAALNERLAEYCVWCAPLARADRERGG